jgi:hypothetical protein
VKRWLFTAFSFTVVIWVSVHAVRTSAPDGVNLVIPPQAHLLAFLGFALEVVARCFKLSWSARAVGARLPFVTAFRTSLGGDFGAAITPARMGAEPARYLILAESGMAPASAIVVMYVELFFEAVSLIVVAGALLVLFDASRAATIAMAGIVGLYSALVFGVGAVAALLVVRNPGDASPAWALRIGLHGARWAFVARWLRRIRGTVDTFRRMHPGWGAASCLASIVHVAARCTILPSLVLTLATGPVPPGPLATWPFALIYGAGIMPAPGGGGAVELAFRASLGRAIPAGAFAASLVWWRFYTFYLYIAIGALVAGNTALRAIREAEAVEEELERA